jgi:hypothetical protein
VIGRAVRVGALAGLLAVLPTVVWGQEVSLRAAPERSPSGVTPVAEPAPAPEESPGVLASMLDATNTSVRGYVRNETAYRYVTPASFSKVLNVMRLETFTPIGDNVELTMVPRVAYDAVYDLEDVDTVHPRRGPVTILTEDQTPELIDSLEADNVRQVQVDRSDAELREVYTDIHFENADLRTGRQIVRWGVVEGSRITDEINPLDFKEFILRDVVDRYIPLWMARWDYYFSSSNLQLLWIPDIRTHKPAPEGTEFEQFQFLPNLDVPDSGVKNAEYAARYSFSLFDAALALSYFDTWDDFPAAFRSIQGVGDNAEFGVTPSVDFIPRPPRLKIYGVTFSRAMGPFIVNAEAAYVKNKLYGTFLGTGVTLPADAVGGEVERNYYKWASSVDFTVLGIDWSLQYMEARILDYDPAIIADQKDVVHAIFVRKTLFDNAFTAQMLAIHFINDNEWVWRPRGDILLTDRIKLSLGADVMTGDIADVGPRGEPLPGQFHFAGFFQNSSRVYVELAYQF